MLWLEGRFDALAVEYGAAPALLALLNAPVEERAEVLVGRTPAAHPTAGREVEGRPAAAAEPVAALAVRISQDETLAEPGAPVAAAWHYRVLNREGRARRPSH